MKDLLKQASPGPWVCDHAGIVFKGKEGTLLTACEPADATLIVEAVNDLPKLLALLGRADCPEDYCVCGTIEVYTNGVFDYEPCPFCTERKELIEKYGDQDD